MRKEVLSSGSRRSAACRQPRRRRSASISWYPTMPGTSGRGNGRATVGGTGGEVRNGGAGGGGGGGVGWWGVGGRGWGGGGGGPRRGARAPRSGSARRWPAVLGPH